MKPGRIVAHKNKQAFWHDNWKTNCSRHLFYENDSPIPRIEHQDCSGWQRHKTRLLWPMWPSTQHISERISEQALSCSLKGGDRLDELAAMDFSMIVVALKPSWLVWILTVIPVRLYFSSFLFCSVLLLNTKLYMLYECYLFLVFITFRHLAI